MHTVHLVHMVFVPPTGLCNVHSVQYLRSSTASFEPSDPKEIPVLRIARILPTTGVLDNSWAQVWPVILPSWSAYALYASKNRSIISPQPIRGAMNLVQGLFSRHLCWALQRHHAPATIDRCMHAASRWSDASRYLSRGNYRDTYETSRSNVFLFLFLSLPKF